MALDGSGNVYVAEALNHRIQKFTSDGQFVTKWGSSGGEDGQFSLPSGIALDSSGNVYVADTGNHRIQKFTSDGRFVTKWGSEGSGDGQFNWPLGIALDGSGNVYVADTLNDRIQKFTSDGWFVTKWGSQESGNVYVADTHKYLAKRQDDNLDNFLMMFGALSGYFLWTLLACKCVGAYASSKGAKIRNMQYFYALIIPITLLLISASVMCRFVLLFLSPTVLLLYMLGFVFIVPKHCLHCSTRAKFRSKKCPRCGASQ
jgi:hypothetical protein